MAGVVVHRSVTAGRVAGLANAWMRNRNCRLTAMRSRRTCTAAPTRGRIWQSAGGQQMEVPMATFIVLAAFSDQGVRNVKQTIERADAFKQMAKKVGATVKDMYWTLGSRDVVAICDAPDDETATALALSVGTRGNVRSETLRAFSFDEMKKILGKMV